MIGYEVEKKWSDMFMPQIKRILGEFLIKEAPEEEDVLRNTDLVVLRLGTVRVACRIRNSNYLEKYGQEFTIRASRPSGKKTELTKIIEGWGDFLFYGFGNDDGDLVAWCLSDLNVFRGWFMARTFNGSPPYKHFKKLNNTDGSSSFYAFNWNRFTGEYGDFIISFHNLPIRKQQ